MQRVTVTKKSRPGHPRTAYLIIVPCLRLSPQNHHVWAARKVAATIYRVKRYHDALFHLISLHCSTEHLNEAKPFVKVL
jgi:hypothetical protein